MSPDIKKLEPKDFPELLKEIDDPPSTLYLKGRMPPKGSLLLCVVGSRKSGEYGRKACSKIIEGLAGHRVAIVSGLALGIDSFAHRSALKAGIPTIAVPGSGLDKRVLYPRGHRGLADDIVRSGGALLSEFEPDFKATKWSFPKRNRIMAGMSHGVLVIEAEERSGTLITARLGLEYNREVCAVPGPIFSSCSSGTNRLIQQGAYPITSADDIRELFNLKMTKTEKGTVVKGLSKGEIAVIELITAPIGKNEVIEKSGMTASETNVLLSLLELKGLISESNGIIYPEKS